MISTDASLTRAGACVRNFGFQGSRQARAAAFNAKLSEYHGAVGHAALDEWEQTREEWNDAAGGYRRALDGTNRVSLQRGFGEAWVGSTCLLGFDRPIADRIEEALARFDIDTRRWWGAGAHTHPATASYPRMPLPATDELARSTWRCQFIAISAWQRSAGSPTSFSSPRTSSDVACKRVGAVSRKNCTAPHAGIASPMARDAMFQSRRALIDSSDRTAGERENDVRHFVSIGVAAVLLCAGAIAAEANYARAAREHTGVPSRLSPGLAVGLSARLLCALQPVSVLVRDHLSARISRPADLQGNNMPKLEISKGDGIRSEIPPSPRRADLRPVRLGYSQRRRGVDRRQGYPS